MTKTGSIEKSDNSNTGFTIIELLVVIVIIAVLAAITIVSYAGITNKAKITSLQSDLTNGSKRLKMYYVEHGKYPATLDGNNCPTGPVDNQYCLNPSIGTTYTYGSVVPSAFRLSATKNGVEYAVTNNTQPMATTSAASCPTGFIPVPGSGTYGTNDFCVMKYEARNVSGVATSQAAGTPWVSISQTDAIATAAAACSGCHLISEAEWLTIVQNVLSVPSNWSTGTVGSGYVYRGHTDGLPNNAIESSTDDNDGYYNTGNTSGSQRRTLTLSNGEVIWDLPGNVWEWSSGTSTTGQPGIIGESAYSWKEWKDITTVGTLIPNPTPVNTGIAGASTWTSSANSIGVLNSYTGETILRAFRRGGSWSDWYNAGVLSLIFGLSPNDSASNLGFRVSK